jgi:hypothetical protein
MKIFVIVLSLFLLSACGHTTKLKDDSVFRLNQRNIIEKDLTSESVSSPLVEQGITTDSGIR